MTAETVDVVVIGGGVTGASTAWHLARRRAGYVLLLEMAELASGATGRSTAIVRTHYMNEELARIALEARRFFEGFGDLVGGDCGFRRTGFLVLSAAVDREAVESNVAMHRRLGIEAQALAPEGLAAIDPRLETEGVGVAAWEPDSGQADPHGTTAAFAAAARALGAEIRTGEPALEIKASNGRVASVQTARCEISTPAVVVAAGFATQRLLSPLGVHVPLTPVRHSVAVLERSAGFGDPHPVISDRVFGAYYMPEGAGLTVVGSTAPFEGEVDEEVEVDRPASAGAMEDLARRFLRRYPGQETARLRNGWTGVYDCSPDLQPLLGPVAEVAGIHVAAGFSGHGFKLSPVVGEMLADSVLGATGRFDRGLFRLSRFAENQLIGAAHRYSVSTLG